MPGGTCTSQTLEAVIAKHGGVLVKGTHAPSPTGACCVLEARSECLGLAWTDDPALVGLPDIRPLNDAPWSSDPARTVAMIRLATAYDGWARQSPARQVVVVQRLGILTVQRLIAELPALPPSVRTQCGQVTTLAGAAEAAWAAAAAVAKTGRTGMLAAEWATWAVWAVTGTAAATRAGPAAALASAAAAAAVAAAHAAETVWAAEEAAAKAADRVLEIAVAIWLEAISPVAEGEGAP